MALIVIFDDSGRSHLIHSGDICPSPRQARATGHWRDVWDRVDVDQAAQTAETHATPANPPCSPPPAGPRTPGWS